MKLKAQPSRSMEYLESRAKGKIYNYECLH